MNTAPKRPRILHLHPSFDEGERELRCVRLINSFGNGAVHAIVSADPARMGARRHIAKSVKVDYPDFPKLGGVPTLGRLNKLAAAMQPYDLICTYDWGAMDGAMAHTLFADVHKLPPLIHHQDGFDEDEAQRLKWRRNFYRRIALGRTAALVVPSRELERIALEVWQQPRSRVQRIPNGVPVGDFGKAPRRDILPYLVKHREEFWIGTLSPLDRISDVPALVRAVAPLPDEWHLVIFGDGPERDAIQAEAEKQLCEHRVHLPGPIDDPAKVMGLFDIVALAPKAAQFPISAVQAMAAGLPVAAPAVGDMAEMVAEENRSFIVDPGDERGLRRSLAQLAGDAAQRQAIGRANRAKAQAEYQEAKMIARYKALYWGVMGRRRS